MSGGLTVIEVEMNFVTLFKYLSLLIQANTSRSAKKYI